MRILLLVLLTPIFSSFAMENISVEQLTEHIKLRDYYQKLFTSTTAKLSRRELQKTYYRSAWLDCYLKSMNNSEINLQEKCYEKEYEKFQTIQQLGDLYSFSEVPQKDHGVALLAIYLTLKERYHREFFKEFC